MRTERLDAAFDLTVQIDAQLSARLLTNDPAPVAVAFSGGGDSLALLLASKVWADAHGRPLLALTVDHGLRPESISWTLYCQERAAALGVRRQTLHWLGEKPTTGLPAAARAARHRLLANATRAAGASVILMGHTADDQAEANLMRRAGSTTPSPKAWAPSPVWPEGRGIFLLRPLLAARRADLRSALSLRRETWIDDPGNVDPRSARARARATIAGGPLPDQRVDSAGSRAFADGDVAFGAAGDLRLPIDLLIDPSHDLARLGAALLCASGAERPPRREPLLRLTARLAAREPFAATLAGCKVICDGQRVHLVRECGDTRGGGMRDILAPPDATAVWDGRFEITARGAGAHLGTVAGHARGLARELRRALLSAPPATRQSMPLVTHADGLQTLPSLRRDPLVEIRPLAPTRLAATLDAIIDEAGLRRMAKTASTY